MPSRNRGGNGGLVGTQFAAQSTPDGYTMVLCSLGVSYAPALYAKLPYDTEKDLLPVSLVATQPFVYVVIPSLGVKLSDGGLYPPASSGALASFAAGPGSTPSSRRTSASAAAPGTVAIKRHSVRQTRRDAVLWHDS